MAIAFISIGSNLGNKKDNILKALKYMRHYAKIVKRSSFYNTTALENKNQPEFLNYVIKIDTDLGPASLLEKCKYIEKLLGRKKTVHWGNRIIDLDIVFYDSSIIQTPNLTIPHKELHKRKFVLYPFVEIEPGWVHPVLKKTVLQLKNLLIDSSQKIYKL